MDGNKQRWAAILLALAAVFYCTWIIEIAFPTGLSFTHSYLSEHAIGGFTLSGWVRWSDRIFGALVLLSAIWWRPAALGAAPRLTQTACPGQNSPVQPREESAPLWAWAAPVSLAIWGLATLGDTFFPLTCAPTISSSCPVSADFAQMGLQDWLHAICSFAANAGLIATVGLATILAPRPGRKVLAYLAILFTILAMLAVGIFELWRINPALGLIQRSQVLLASLWLSSWIWQLGIGSQVLARRVKEK